MAKKKSDASRAGRREETSAGLDPLELWREWIDRTERHWNTTLTDLTSSESFNQAQGRFLDSLLALQSQMNSATERYFALVNLPSRTDVLSLGNQLASIEERLVALEKHVRRLSEEAGGDARESAPPPPRPKRTRKAPRRESKAADTSKAKGDAS